MSGLQKLRTDLRIAELFHHTDRSIVCNVVSGLLRSAVSVFQLPEFLKHDLPPGLEKPRFFGIFYRFLGFFRFFRFFKGFFRF